MNNSNLDGQLTQQPLNKDDKDEDEIQSEFKFSVFFSATKFHIWTILLKQSLNNEVH